MSDERIGLLEKTEASVCRSNFWRKRGRHDKTMTDDNVIPPDAPVAFVSFLCYSDENLHNVLSFVLGSVAALPSIASVDRQLYKACMSPGAWKDVSIDIPARALSDQRGANQIIKMGIARWGLAKEVRLPAHPAREVVKASLQTAFPALQLSVHGEGPYPLFVMRSHLAVGETTGLRFFEPRYRWMCQRMFAEPGPHKFGFVTSGGGHPGSCCVVCEVIAHHLNPDGTYSTDVRAIAKFSILEVWFEEVPGNITASPLALGFVGPTLSKQCAQAY